MNVHVDILCNLIIQNYLLNSRCLIIFTDEGNTFEFNGSLPTVNIRGNKTFIHTQVFLKYFGCQGIVIKSNTPVTIFQEFEKEIRLSYERFNKRKFIVAPGLDMSENLRDIILSKEIKYVAELIIIEPKINIIKKEAFWLRHIEAYELWTHKYKGFENNTQKEVLDVWYSGNQSFQNNGNLYPEKLKNQMGRVLKIGTMHYPPYEVIDGFSIDEYKGTELSAMFAFIKYLNMTPELYIDPQASWGDIYPNWTGKGLMASVLDDTADIALGSFCMWNYLYQYFDFSIQISQTGITSLVPTPRLAAGWLTPWYSYSTYMWSFVGATFILCLLAHFLLTLLKIKITHLSTHQQTSSSSFGNSLLTICKLFLVQCVSDSEMLSGINGTIFMGSLFIYSLFLSTTYSSGLATIMTIPRYDHPIRTAEDLANSELPWVAPDEIWNYQMVNSDNPFLTRISDRFVNEPNEDKIREYSKTRDYALAIEKITQGAYAIQPFLHRDVIENFTVMNEDFYGCTIVLLARKSSVLLPLLNNFFGITLETGLSAHWLSEAMVLFTDSYIQKALTSSNKQQQFAGKLKWVHVEGAFGILIFGYVLSIVTFLLEFAVYYFGIYKLNKQRRQTIH